MKIRVYSCPLVVRTLYGSTRSFRKTCCRSKEKHHRDFATRRSYEIKEWRSGDRRCSSDGRMGRRTYSRRDAHESRHDRARHRRKSARSERDDHLSLRRRRPVRTCRRDPAENGLQKRPLNGRRLQSVEDRWLTDNEVMWTHERVDSDLPRHPAPQVSCREAECRPYLD